jgi:hypothetical protein
MSHTTTIPFCIRDLNALKIAVSKIQGLQFLENRKTFKTYGSDRKCVHAIGLVNHKGMGFEIGVLKAKENEYELAFDSFDSALAEIVGYSCENVIQGYAAQLVIQEVPFGWEYTQTPQPDGDILMELSH